jgi:hypothetical protein
MDSPSDCVASTNLEFATADDAATSDEPMKSTDESGTDLVAAKADEWRSADESHITAVRTNILEAISESVRIPKR